MLGLECFAGGRERVAAARGRHGECAEIEKGTCKRYRRSPSFHALAIHDRRLTANELHHGPSPVESADDDPWHEGVGSPLPALLILEHDKGEAAEVFTAGFRRVYCYPTHVVGKVEA